MASTNRHQNHCACRASIQRADKKRHPGSNLRKATQPDKIVVHGIPGQCQACQRQLAFAYVSETRQVFDLPSLEFEVTEHHAMQAICCCGQVHTGEFPSAASACVQYGPRAHAAMVHLNQNHAVSIQRTAALMHDFFGLPVSQATVVKAYTHSWLMSVAMNSRLTKSRAGRWGCGVKL